MTRRAELLSQQQLRKRIYTRGEAVYQCDACSRKIRIPLNKYSFDTTGRCIITKGCLGELHKVLTKNEINNTTTIPPSLPGLTDWSQRRVFFSHTQPVENNIWTIEHNLANKPSVQVFITQLVDGEEVLVETDQFTERVVDLNTIELTFARREKGLVQCLATASANTTNKDIGTSVVSTSSIVLTKNSELTIATLSDAPLVTFTIRYRSAAVEGGIVDITYVDIDDQTSIDSPWVGTNKIFVGGKTYTVRSFNLRTQQNAPQAFAEKQIANGTQFYFLDASTTPKENLILLGTSPFESVDKIVDQYIDIALINQAQPEIAYAGNEVYASPSIIRSTYPQIYIVD